MSKSNPHRIIGFFNSHLDTGDAGISGGDMCFLQVFEHLDFSKKIVFTPQSGKQLCNKYNISADYIVTSKEKIHGNVPITWIKRTVRAIKQLPSLKKNDVIYTASDFFVDVIPSFFAKLNQNDIIWTQCILHLIPHPSKRTGNFFINVSSYLIQKFSHFFIKRYADVIIVDSPLIKEQLLERNFQENKIFVGYEGAEIEKILEIPTSLTNSFDAYYMGRLHKSKGIYDLIQIWKIIVDRYPDKTLALIGTASKKIKETLILEIKRNNLENNITLLGFLPTHEAMSRMKNGKLFLFPSHEEGFGIVIVEAMACGLPVISWDLRVYEQLFFDKITTIPKYDYEKFAEKCMELLSDLTLRAQIVKKGLFFSTRYSWSNVAKRHKLIINSQLAVK